MSRRTFVDLDPREPAPALGGASASAGRAARERWIHRRGVRAALLALPFATVAACSDAPSGGQPTAERVPPWQRTEDRAPCDAYEPLRSPLFGDLHVHTRFSADAYIFGTRVGPRDAYAFARGEAMSFSDDNEDQTRTARIDRPLDFAAVTDHSEFFGEVDLCSTPGSPVYDIKMCADLRKKENPEDRFPVTVEWLFLAGIPNPPKSHAFCSTPGIDCDAAAVSVWREIQAAAESAYDRSSACAFTALIGYEHTSSLIGRHTHRNIVFRNDHVPGFAKSYLETAAGGIPQGVWTAVENDCLDAGTGCDAVVIPHNSNLSGGMQFEDPLDAADARRRQDREPLAEIHQIKGNSECRFDRIAGLGVGTDDELCAYEQLTPAHEGPDEPPPPIQNYPERNMLRNVLKDGLALEAKLGSNPFKFGFIGSTDNHDAAAGSVGESTWPGGQGNDDASPARKISNEIRTNPGGLAVVWAEENSRDAVFSALKRRETYATSGTRPVLRFFGGALGGVSCDDPDLVRHAYETGAPMGGDVGDVRPGASPRFAVLAMKDPGTKEAPGADLQRAQIVKGWLDADGGVHEKVFDVAGDASNGADVDPQTCERRGRGARELCTVWEDPEFDATRPAFYYVRLLETPTCRWSTLVCKAQGVDPFADDCAQQAERAGSDYANCCLAHGGDPTLTPTVQERAWSSPIWYRPEAIADVTGSIDRGEPGAGKLDLTLRLGASPAAFDPTAAETSLALSDDDRIFSLTVPAGAWTPRSGGAPAAWHYDGGAITADFARHADGTGELRVSASGVDLQAANPTDHAVRIDLESGSYRSSYTRFWRASGGALEPVAD